MNLAGGHDVTDTATARAVPATRRERLDALLTPGTLLVLAAMVLSLLAVTSVIRDPDFWWHLRTGQLIVAHGGLLSTDPFTYTVPGHAWTMHEWLTEVLYALLQPVGGLGLIIVVLSAVTWIGVVCVALRASLRSPGRATLGLGLLLAVVAGYPIWGPRVQMVTFCFSALTLLLLERHLTRGGRAIWLLVPLMVLWSNLHSGFIIGLGFIALVIAAEAVAPWLRLPDAAPRERLRPLLLLLLACTAASMLNPNGPGILLYAFQTQGSAAQQSLILEWHSPDFHQWALLPYGLMLLSLVVLVVVNRRLRARDAALVLATTALSLQSVRHIALFVAACAPVWIDQASTLLARRRGGRPARRRAQPPLFFRVVLFGGLALLLLGLYAGARLIPAIRTQPNSLAYAQEFPVCATRWLAQAKQPLNIFNQYGEGGYLAYRLSARGDRVFIFGDAALMGDPLLYSYADVEGVQTNWESIIERAGTDVVLFDTNTPLANLVAQSRRWVKVYQDPLSVAFVPASRLYTLPLPAVPTSYPAGDVCAQLQTAPALGDAVNQ